MTADRMAGEETDATRRAERLKAALATGRMGEWSWDRRRGVVSWDANVHMLFGLADAEFPGTFEGWIARIHPDDREMVQESVATGVARREPFRFDHRCVWPDGSVHWLEGIGDVVVAGDEVTGAFGLAIDVDERHRDIEERSRLIEIERRARERVEYLNRMNEVLTRSLQIDEIVGTVTNAVIPELAEWCAIVVSVDRPRRHPLIVVAHGDPLKVRWAEQIQRDYPYDPDSGWGAAGVISSGKRELVPVVDPSVFSLPGGQVLAEVGLRSVLTVPITGALGILGAMQLIRGDAQPSFGFADLELMEELAGRIGAAMNTAVLFDRQARTSAAFETLERVSGGIAAAATTTEIFRAVTTHGAAGVGAHGASLLLSDEVDAVLRVAESTHADDSDVVASHLEVGAEALAGAAIVRRAIHGSDEERGGRTPMALAMPLSVMNRVLGALVFTFDDEREFTREEMSMFVTLGSRCAGALERARLYERERAIALTLQNRLMSTLPATPPWITVAACYQPATRMEIGGDWYQVLDAGSGRIVAVVGDAVGHGLSAAAAMGQLRASIATAVANDAEPDHALAAVDLFAVRGADTLGASVAYVLLDEGAPARYASAGHLPLLSVTADGRTALLEDGRRPLLGFRERDAVNVTADVAFGPGDTIVMFTDGLIERRGEWIDAGLDRLQRVVESSRLLSPQALCDTIILELTAGETVADDIALLVLRRNAVE